MTSQSGGSVEVWGPCMLAAQVFGWPDWVASALRESRG